MRNKFIIITFVIYLFALVLQMILSLGVNDFNFSYALDDPFIHMSIAKNFSEFGIWGPTQYEFASASSSLLFTLLISLVNLIGIKTVLVPLVLNILSTYILIIVIDKYFSRWNLADSIKYIFGLLLLLLMPIIALTISGMEHILHAALLLLLIYNVLLYLETGLTKYYTAISLFSILSVAARYESLFVIFIIGIIFLLRKRYSALVNISFFAALPVVIFGIISVSNGSYFLPNTLLIKGVTPELTFGGLLEQMTLWLWRLIKYPHLLASFILSVYSFIYIRNKIGCHSFEGTFALVTFLSWIVHLTFAGIGWFYRYEAYLVVMSMLNIVPLLNEMIVETGGLKALLRRKLVLFSIVVLFLPFLYRLTSSLYKSTYAIKNIYEQQVKMAEYVKAKEYKSIVLNDIGAVSFYNNIRLVDVLGLASINVVIAIREGEYNTEILLKYADEKNAEAAFLYKDILKFPIPEKWLLIDSIKIENNVVCWDDVVYIYEIKNNNIME